ncbi:MAG TPA: CsbD family protein [Pirellulales bacterium]|jgi:uncharacterized protein YjbJ (UPF0337 family)|nr:CsbD family protein [Pirellulales bacterium]
MNWNQVEGNWPFVRDKVRQRWDHLTEEDLSQIGGRREELTGFLQERYGLKKEEAEHAADGFAHGLLL